MFTVEVSIVSRAALRAYAGRDSDVNVHSASAHRPARTTPETRHRAEYHQYLNVERRTLNVERWMLNSPGNRHRAEYNQYLNVERWTSNVGC